MVLHINVMKFTDLQHHSQKEYILLLVYLKRNKNIYLDMLFLSLSLAYNSSQTLLLHILVIWIETKQQQ
jgi:hypothetical protein